MAALEIDGQKATLEFAFYVQDHVRPRVNESEKTIEGRKVTPPGWTTWHYWLFLTQ